MKKQIFPVAFEAWHNGGLQKSSFYWSVTPEGCDETEFTSFVRRHKRSGTYATLYVCHTEEELKKVLKEIGYYDSR